MMEIKSIFKNIPSKLPEELINTICSTDSVKVERIVSRGRASPEGFWYDQEKSEFVLVLRGSAGLRLEGQDDLVILQAGDYINIGAHVKHRVEWTDSAGDTIWIAVYY